MRRTYSSIESIPAAGGGRRGAFTIVELLVATAILVVLVALITQIFGLTMTATGLRNKNMDADEQARAVFDRMAVDFAGMIKRPDVDYFLKCSAQDQYGNTLPQAGAAASSGSNDQMAFYSQVPGYYPTTNGTSQSPVSLVAYRVAANQLQRLGDGLVWNGVGTYQSMVFSTGASGPSTTGTQNAIVINWPTATGTASDPNYEAVGPEVFRMEYYYVLKGTSANPSMLSDTPWDLRAPTSHTSVGGLQDVAALTVVIAVADPKSRLLVNSAQLTTLAGAMEDFPSTNSTGYNTTPPGALQAQWQSAINSAAISRIAASAIRIYTHTFYLPSNPAVNPL